MPDTPSITIVKKFTYRGNPEEYGNTYHFSGTTPANAADWKTLADAIIAQEKLFHPNTVSFVKAYGYAAGSDDSVAQIDYTLAPNVVVTGTSGNVAGMMMSGDQAATVRWYTGASARGKKIYCRKYFHRLERSSSDDDALASTIITKLNTFAAKMIDGTLPGSFKYCGPQGAVLSAPAVNQWLTTRTLKRRGKRPPTSGSS